MGVGSILRRRKWGDFDDWPGEDSIALTSGRAKEEGALVTCRMRVGVPCSQYPTLEIQFHFPEVTELQGALGRQICHT